MPYPKKVKDREGAVAEAIGAELAALSGLSHPAKDSPPITIQNKSGNHIVTLPEYSMESNLSDKIFDSLDGEPMPDSEKFLESLGEVIAFNWYIGQGDLNMTNIAIFKGKCYPYDFDCCFQNIQSPTSFAQTSIREFSSKDLDSVTKNTDIVDAAISNLSSSANTVGMDSSLDYLSNDKNKQIIERGFKKAAERIEKIDLSDIQNIVTKHVSTDKEKDTYVSFLEGKKNNIITEKYQNQLAVNVQNSPQFSNP